MDDFWSKVLLYPLCVFFPIIASLGMACNLAMTIVTLKSKRLRSSCHLLIGLICFSDFLHQSGQGIFVFNLYNGFSTVSHDACVYIQLPAQTGILFGTTMLLSLCLDRFYAVMKPMSYRIVSNNPLYFLAQLVLPTAYTAYFLVKNVQNADPNVQTICPLPACFTGSRLIEWSYSTVVQTAFCAIVYAIAGIFLALSTDTTSASSKRIFKSILVIVFLVVCGTMLTLTTNAFAASIEGLDPLILEIIQMYAGIPINLAVASNFIVYFKMSSEHRMAIQETFPNLLRRLRVYKNVSISKC